MAHEGTDSGARLKGWLGVVWPVLQSASPLSVLLILLLCAFQARWMTREITRVHTVNQLLWQQLVEAQKTQMELSARCGAAGRP